MRVAPRQQSFVPYPLALLALPFALGILAAHLLAPALAASLLLIASLLFAAVCSLLTVYFLARQRQGVATILICCAFFGAGTALALLEKRGVAADRVRRLYEDGTVATGDPVEVTGVLTSAPEPAPEIIYLTLRVEKVRIKEKEQAASGVVEIVAPARDRSVRAGYDALELRYGARVRVMTALERPEKFLNPGVPPMTEYLEQRGFDATGMIKSPLLVERLDDERVFLPLAWLYEWRQRLLREINAKFSPETAGVLDAALLGNRHYLSHDTAERFREGGTFHVLAINGLHISFIGGLIFLIARRLTKRRGWQFLLSATFLWAYSIAVGAAPPIVRAALMFTLVALAPVLYRRARSLNALGGAALVLLIWRPADLFDPSFQLTILSVLTIVALAVPLIQRLQEVGAWRPTRETPHPPVCPRWWRTLGELLFWSEKQWELELSRTTWSCRLFKSPLAARLERLHVQRFLRYAFSAVVVSASVQVGLLPVLVLYFHRFSLASFLINIFVNALMATVALVALVALALSQLSAGIAAPLCFVAERVDWLMVRSVEPFSGAGVADIRLPEYTGWAACLYALYFLPLAILAISLARWNPLRPPSVTGGDENMSKSALMPQLASAAFVALLALIIFHPFSAGLPDGRLRIDFLDVGQGDAALVTMPDGTTLLVDAGGRPHFRQRKVPDQEEEDEPFVRDSPSIGEAVVSQYLWWRGLDHVDHILATHADADHIDGLNDVARNFRVRDAIVARTPSDDLEYVRFATTTRERGVPVSIVNQGDVLRFGAVTADVLWPPHIDNPDAPSRNNDSLALCLHFGEKVFLLTGDMEKEAEGAILSSGEELTSDVVKVAHHGSQTSSTEAFVTATHPKLAIISVGLVSPFGHPGPEVVKRWRASGAEVLTTGSCGTITISTDGHDLRVSTFARQK